MPAAYPDFVDESYVPPGTPRIHYNQRYSVWIPHQPKPPLGYPCLILNNGGGWASGIPQSELNEQNGHIWLMLQRGWVIVSMGVTGSGQTTLLGGTTSTGCISHTDFTYFHSLKRLAKTGAFTSYVQKAGDYVVVYGGTGATSGIYEVDARIGDDSISLKTSIGAAADTQIDIQAKVHGPLQNMLIPGRGIVKPPGNALFFTTAFTETDGAKCIQAVRRNAARYGINPNMVCMEGRSGGTTGTKGAQFFPDFASAPGFWQGVSSRPNVIYLRALAVEYYPSCVQTGSDGIAFAPHMPKNTDATYETVAAVLSEVAAPSQINASTLKYGFDPTITYDTIASSVMDSRQQLIRATNSNVKVIIFASGSGPLIMGSTDFSNGTTSQYSGNYVSGAVLATHDPWNSYTLREEIEELGVSFGPQPRLSKLIVDQATEDYVAEETGGDDYAADVIIEAGDGSTTDPLEVYLAEEFQAHADALPIHSTQASSSMFHVGHTLG